MLKFALPLIVLFFAACGPAAAKCTTANCTGCCDQKTDTCVAGSEATACGTGGALCIECPSAQVCKSDRTCGAMQVTLCGPQNCAGCCDSSSTCQTAQTASACGSAGNACAVCTGAQTCVNKVCQ